jgi:PAS domain S-box-containing protein
MKQTELDLAKFTLELIQLTDEIVAETDETVLLTRFFDFIEKYFEVESFCLFHADERGNSDLMAKGCNAPLKTELVREVRQLWKKRKGEVIIQSDNIHLFTIDKNSFLFVYYSSKGNEIDRLFRSAIEVFIKKLKLSIRDITLRNQLSHLQDDYTSILLIVEAMDELDIGVQIADVQGKIIYLNKLSRKRLGILDFKQKDYYVSDFEPLFKKKDAWLEHIMELRECKSMVINSVNISIEDKIEIPVEVTVRLATISNKEYVVAVVKDKSLLHSYEELIKKKELMLDVLSDVTHDLLETDDIVKSISSGLKSLGIAIEVDRTYLFTNEYLEDGTITTSQRIEWNSGAKSPQIDNPELQNLPINTFEDFLEKLNNNLPYQNIVSKIEDEELRGILEMQDIVTILLIPIFENDRLWGFVGYDDCTRERVWDKSEIKILQTFSKIISKSVERKKNKDLIESYARFPLENPEPILRIDLEGKILLQNKPAERLKELIIEDGTIVSEMLDLKTFCVFIAREIGSGSKLRTTIVRDQDRFTYSAVIKPIKKDKVINIYMSDISELIHTTNKLNRANQLIDNIHENLEDVIWSISIPNYEVVFLSDSVERLTGYKKVDFTNDFKYWTKLLPPGDTWVIEKINADLMNVGEASFDHRLKRANDTEIWVKNKSKIICNENGLPVRIDGVLSDITKEKEYETLMKFQEEKFRRLNKNMNLGLLEVDNDGIILFANEAFVKMAGYTKEQLIGRIAHEVFPVNGSKKTIEDKIALRSSGVSDSYEVKVFDGRGEERWWLISGAPNTDKNGEVIGSIGIHLDITNQKRVEQELMESKKLADASNQAKEDFLANMSHEIRTPLNGIIGLANELKESDLEEQNAEMVNHIYSSGKHLLSLINQILELSKISSGEVKIHKNQFDMRDLAQDVISIIAPIAKEKGLELVVQIDSRIGETYYGDQIRIKQCLLNLLSNSVKFTDSGSVTLSIDIHQAIGNEEEVRFSVSDTGRGMSKEFLDAIYDKFTQENKDNVSEDEGIGLGMAITKQIVELLDGWIEIASESKRGTMVQILIPLNKTEKNIINQFSLEIDHKDYEELKGMRILVAEDNEVNLLVVRRLLTKKGIDVFEAKNGQEAVKIAENLQPDIVLMDIHMPVCDGVEALQIIRKRGLNMPVFAITADVINSNNNRYDTSGFDGIIIKPFEPSDLFSKLLSVMSKKYLSSDVIDGITGGDEDFKKEFIGLLNESFTEGKNKINDALESKKIEDIGFIVHKLKGSILLLNIDEIIESVLLLSDVKEGEMTFNDVEKHAKKIVIILNRLIHELDNQAS